MTWDADFDDESEANIERDREENPLFSRPRRTSPPGPYTPIAITQAVRSMYFNAYGLTLDFYGS